MNRHERNELATLIRREIEAALEARFGPLPDKPTPLPVPPAQEPEGTPPHVLGELRRMVHESIDREAIAQRRKKGPRRR